MSEPRDEVVVTICEAGHRHLSTGGIMGSAEQQIAKCLECGHVEGVTAQGYCAIGPCLCHCTFAPEQQIAPEATPLGLFAVFYDGETRPVAGFVLEQDAKRFAKAHSGDTSRYEIRHVHVCTDSIDTLKRRAEAAEALADSLGHPVASPCGHSGAHAYSEDGGKNIRCLLCSEATLKRRVEELEAQAVRLVQEVRAAQRAEDFAKSDRTKLQAQVEQQAELIEELKEALRYWTPTRMPFNSETKDPICMSHNNAWKRATALAKADERKQS